MAEVPPVKRALLSVSDKAGLADFAKGLAALGVELVSTGGTAKALRDAGLAVRDVSDVTGFPEMMDGRVKTLHPKVHGGLLGVRSNAEHAAAAQKAGIGWIDLVVVNLYPFEATIAKPGVTREEAIEQIDIGGPSMVRSAAKNADWVGIVTRPDQYAGVLAELRAHGGLTEPTRRRLAAEAFATTAAYDRAIALHLNKLDRSPGQKFRFEHFMQVDDRMLQLLLLDIDVADLSLSLQTAEVELMEKFQRNMPKSKWLKITEYMEFAAPVRSDDIEAARQRVMDAYLDMPPEGSLRLLLHPLQSLRYGENPHQAGALYAWGTPQPGTVAGAKVLGGKELSYNNLLDADAAWGLVNDLPKPATVIIKHLTPCGAAARASLAESFRKALEGDPVSAFGGIVALNAPLDLALAREIAADGNFFEVIVAPAIAEDARDVFLKGDKWRAKARLLETGALLPSQGGARTIRTVSGGVLVQAADATVESPASWKTVTTRAMTPSEQADAALAWAVAKHVKSNAIVLVKDRQVVGVGAGQMNRLDSVFLACRHAKDKAKGAALASDAFFPFRDGLDEAAKAGVAAVVQPGGSIRDKDVVAAADGHGMAMAFTGVRHFRH